MTTIVTVFVSILALIICKVYGECNQTSQICPSNEHCIAQSAKLIYPDLIDNPGQLAVIQQKSFACNSEAYCKWVQMWDVNCIRIYVPDKLFPGAFYNEDTKTCIVINAEITINETVSCCQDTMDCNSTFHAIVREKEESIYATTNCVPRAEIAEIVEGIVDCYATKEFMKYIKCNITNYQDKCPLFFWNNLQTYAKCACLKLGEVGDDSYEYFSELTEMIEGIFAAFRHKKQEKCPEWVFSCDSDGHAELDVYEIICKVDIDTKTDLVKLKRDIEVGVSSLTDAQVEIFGDYVRVLMYSEQEGWDALDWLSLNETETTPEEINGVSCRMEETKWDLNEIYGDYVPPTTPSPTDDCSTVSIIIAVMMFLFVSVFML
eukprot:400305_1